ncbi:MAG: HPr family phosphocarrier protein [Oligosphaeraceae bacterium]|nr:HPr family phosphocarrier protein [Oligosphaeraceae bacterium]
MPVTAEDTMLSREVSVRNKRGLHLRFAGQITQIAAQFDAMVRLQKGEQSADARSTLSMLTLQAGNGSKLLLQAEGAQASEALQAVADFIENYGGSP